MVFKRTVTSPLVNDKGEQASWNVYHKKYLGNAKGAPVSVLPKSLVGMNDSGTKEVMELFEGALFDNPKSVRLMKYLLEFGCDEDGLVLDFFSGSGTTAHAVSQLNAEDGGNRRWICVQLPELTSEKTEAYKAGYTVISDLTRERIRRASNKIKEDFADQLAERKVPLDLGFRSYRLGDSNFRKWNEQTTDPEKLRQQTLENLDPLEPNAKDDDLIAEILLKRGISPLVGVEQHDGFIFIPSKKLAISLSRGMTEELFGKILSTEPTHAIFLDQAFHNDLNLKTNLVLQAEKQNISVEIL
ncbi:type III restriction-modification system methylation subunit [candidate division TM7 genomosp. GTL1]|nr:type III restriction-modification system methylation subunit [candidate division TM7 genomosp. GTL1]